MLKALFVGIMISSLAGGAMAASYGSAPAKTGATMSAPAAMAMSSGAPAKIGTTSMGKAWVDLNGMTLYTFDKDTATKSACNGKCAVEWPPLKAAAGAKPLKNWTIVARADGSKMWAYKGHPLYTFVDDKKPGDVTGDNKDGFHLAK
jgi:predicted lipoprotein with Yx(FWY)xxD motif